MDKDIVISVKNVSKTFRIFHLVGAMREGGLHEMISSIRGAFVGMFSSFHLPFVMGTCFRGKQGSEGGVSYEEFKA